MSEKLECVRCGHETYKHPSMLECRGCTDCAPPPSADAAFEELARKYGFEPTEAIRAALAAERERCARIAKNAPDVCDCADRIAAAIRDQK